MGVSCEYVFNKLNIKNKQIFILGLGSTGKSVHKFFSLYQLNILCWDDSAHVREQVDNAFQLQHFKELDVTKIDFIVVSPGIPLFCPQKHYIVSQSIIHNVPIYTDIELFMLLFPNKKYISVTGTNGKSTVSSLVHHIFVDNNIKAEIGGNIGVPALNLVSSMCADIIIFEVSSYQLEIMNFNDKVRFNIAIFLNFTADHISYHGSLDNYFKAKLFILKNQSQEDTLIIYNPLLDRLKELNIKLKQNIITISNKESQNVDVFYTDSNITYHDENILENTILYNLQGEHNLQNISFAFSCAKLFGLKTDDILISIKSFQGLPHRQEVVLSYQGITFINDSKSTTVDSTIQAIKTFKDNIFLILGGIRKEDSLENLIPYLQGVTLILLIGESQEVFANCLHNNNVLNFIKCNTMNIALNSAYFYIKKEHLTNANVLLSPGCASFDQYKNFMDRGNTFKMLVRDLVNNDNK